MTGEKDALIMSGEDINYLHGPMVYIWWRGDMCMYIGASSFGMRRILSPSHLILGKMWPTDSIEMLRCGSWRMAFKLELELIRKYKPPLNRKGIAKNSSLTSLVQPCSVLSTKEVH